MGEEVRIADSSDVAELAEIHATSWDAQELSVKLGRPYLRSFYRSVVEYENAFCIVAGEPGAITGYACGFFDYEGFSNWFRNRHFALLSGLLAVRVLTGRLSVGEVVDSFRYSAALKRLSDPKFHLGALALRNDLKGTPVGASAIKATIGRVLVDLEARGAHSYWGVCDVRNIPMCRYLVKLGFEEIDRPKLKTRALALFERKLHTP